MVNPFCLRMNKQILDHKFIFFYSVLFLGLLGITHRKDKMAGKSAFSMLGLAMLPANTYGFFGYASVLFSNCVFDLFFFLSNSIKFVYHNPSPTLPY